MANKIFYSFIFFIFILLIVLRFVFMENALLKKEHFFDPHLGQKVSGTARVISFPEVDHKSISFVAKTENTNIKILFRTNNTDLRINYNDTFYFEGILDKAKDFVTDTGKTFDYKNYLRKDGVLYIVAFPKISEIKENKKFGLKDKLFELRKSFNENISFTVPAPESALLSGMLLGERGGLKSLENDFIKTGTIHIVALSGYNVSLVAEFLISIILIIFSLFSFVSYRAKNLSFVFGMIGILLFVLMTGAEATAVRAGIMAGLVFLGKILDRDRDMIRIILITLFLMVLYNPYTLLYDVSFALSFIATIAILFYTPRIEKYFYFLPKDFKIRELVASTTAVYIFVLPYILYKMGSFSLVAILVNIIILPFVPYAMFFGFISGLLGFASYFLSIPFGAVAHQILHFQIWVVEYFANLPFGFYIIPNFPLWLTILIYVYFVWFLWWGQIRKHFDFTSSQAKP